MRRVLHLGRGDRVGGWVVVLSKCVEGSFGRGGEGVRRVLHLGRGDRGVGGWVVVLSKCVEGSFGRGGRG